MVSNNFESLLSVVWLVYMYNVRDILICIDSELGRKVTCRRARHMSLSAFVRFAGDFGLFPSKVAAV